MWDDETGAQSWLFLAPWPPQRASGHEFDGVNLQSEAGTEHPRGRAAAGGAQSAPYPRLHAYDPTMDGWHESVPFLPITCRSRLFTQSGTLLGHHLLLLSFMVSTICRCKQMFIVISPKRHVYSSFRDTC